MSNSFTCSVIEPFEFIPSAKTIAQWYAIGVIRDAMRKAETSERSSSQAIHKYQRLNEVLDELTRPLHVVTVDGWLCRASSGAMKDWKEEGRKVRMICRAKSQGQGSARSAETVSFTQDSDRAKMLQNSLTVPEGTHKAFWVWQTVFRLARLDSIEPLPSSDCRARHYLTTEPLTPEAIAYRVLWEGSARWLRHAPEKYRTTVAPYVASILWQLRLPQDGQRAPRIEPITAGETHCPKHWLASVRRVSIRKVDPKIIASMKLWSSKGSRPVGTKRGGNLFLFASLLFART